MKLSHDLRKERRRRQGLLYKGADMAEIKNGGEQWRVL